MVESDDLILIDVVVFVVVKVVENLGNFVMWKSTVKHKRQERNGIYCIFVLTGGGLTSCRPAFKQPNLMKLGRWVFVTLRGEWNCAYYKAKNLA